MCKCILDGYVMYVSVDISFWSDKVLRFQKKQELTLI